MIFNYATKKYVAEERENLKAKGEIIMNVFGYETITTFWQDFSIGEMFGIAGVKDTYRKAFKEWKGNYKYLTELVMVLNWKFHQHCEKEDPVYKTLYEELWREADSYACENLKGEELSYFYRTTD